MGTVTTGKSGLALLLAGGGAPPNFMVIGSGSGADLSGATWIYGDLDLPRSFTSVDSGTVAQVTFQGDWDAITMSGLRLSNFGVTTGSAISGTLWGIEPFDGEAIIFDGTTELQVQVTYEVF